MCLQSRNFGRQAFIYRDRSYSRSAHYRPLIGRRSGPIAFTSNTGTPPIDINTLVAEIQAKLSAEFQAQLQQQEEKLRAEFQAQLQQQEAKQQQQEAKQQQQEAKQQQQEEKLRAEFQAQQQQQEAKQQLQEEKRRAEFQAQLQQLDERLQGFRSEVAPLQKQFVRNVVHQVARFVLTNTKPTTRNAPASSFVDHATAAQLQSLADAVSMDPEELKNELRPLTLLRNAGEHPCSLEVLRQMVADAVKVCGEKPEDGNLAFALRFLSQYEAIETKFLL